MWLRGLGIQRYHCCGSGYGCSGGLAWKLLHAMGVAQKKNGKEKLENNHLLKKFIDFQSLLKLLLCPFGCR